MAVQTSAELLQKHCVPCEGGVTPIGKEEAQIRLSAVPGWRVSESGKSLRRDWVVENFMAGLAFFRLVGELAEAEGHHPDLHLVGYRNVWIELSTHAINGLSENDFILAAKINQLPVKVKVPKGT